MNPTISKKIKYHILGWISLILLNGSILVSYAASPQVQEYEVKAMFLFYFSKFIDYPESVLNTRTKIFRICIFGEDPFQKALDLAVQGKDAHGYPIEIKRLAKGDAVNGCQILFISSAESSSALSEVFSSIRQYPILTVSDADNFIESGGMIQFYVADNKVRFMIDIKKTQKVNLKVSSRLLQVAQIVGN